MIKKWLRGGVVGRGSFATVNLAIPAKRSSSSFGTESDLMVVKSSEASNSSTLKNEKEILSRLPSHPNVVKFLGDETTLENGRKLYNLFFEFAPDGNLSDHRNGVSYHQVRVYAKSILKGLDFIHSNGFVHCDIKLANILLFDDGEVAKIADFGLAKKAGENNGKYVFRGTPMYMSPEAVNSGECESPADIWAFGCAVIEMMTGKPAWRCTPGCDVNALLYRIGSRRESPEIPAGISPAARDFLEKCFVRDPNERWTAKMLLDHALLSGSDEDELIADLSKIDGDEKAASSPRCPMEFPDSETFTLSSEYSSSDGIEFSLESESSSWCLRDVSGRIEELAGDRVPDWCDTGDWVRVR